MRLKHESGCISGPFAMFTLTMYFGTVRDAQRIHDESGHICILPSTRIAMLVIYTTGQPDLEHDEWKLL
jgi:hypothetical protein